jgi:hypothetical protein
MTLNDISKRIEKLEAITGAQGQRISRWCTSPDDADRQYAEMKASGELEGVAQVTFVRWHGRGSTRTRLQRPEQAAMTKLNPTARGQEGC